MAGELLTPNAPTGIYQLKEDIQSSEARRRQRIYQHNGNLSELQEKEVSQPPSSRQIKLNRYSVQRGSNQIAERREEVGQTRLLGQHICGSWRLAEGD